MMLKLPWHTTGRLNVSSELQKRRSKLCRTEKVRQIITSNYSRPFFPFFMLSNAEVASSAQSQPLRQMLLLEHSKPANILALRRHPPHHIAVWISLSLWEIQAVLSFKNTLWHYLFSHRLSVNESFTLRLLLDVWWSQRTLWLIPKQILSGYTISHWPTLVLLVFLFAGRSMGMVCITY